MRVLGIDPGYDRVGVAVMEHHPQTGEVLIFSTCIETNQDETVSSRLFTVGTAITDILKTYTPDAIGIETIFFNKNQKTAIGVAQARGILIYLAQLHNCTVYEFGPQEIKVAVTGYGKSDKAAIIDMVCRLIPNAPEKALDDEYDAIAVGITTLAHHRS